MSKALSVAQATKHHQAEGSYFSATLESPTLHLGDAHKAIEYYEQALVISREIGDRRE